MYKTKRNRLLLFILMSAIITIGQYQTIAAEYSSEYTRKWAAQRKAAEDKNRRNEQKRLEKERKRKQLQQLYFGNNSGGANLGNEPAKKYRPAGVDSQVDKHNESIKYGSNGDCEAGGILGSATNCVKSKPSRRWMAGPWLGEGPCKFRVLNNGERTKEEYADRDGFRYRCINYRRSIEKRECRNKNLSCTVRVGKRVTGRELSGKPVRY